MDPLAVTRALTATQNESEARETRGGVNIRTAPRDVAYQLDIPTLAEPNRQ